ncbi:hypothetical protein Scep_022862 [Stephania cephalantha]|uniref:FAD-binding PCMH-type domain-containing protein n=1 Tax=Stephania cephalantha TaxID=152367 RepID=A0AAP0HY68_9MAGN
MATTSSISPAFLVPIFHILVLYSVLLVSASNSSNTKYEAYLKCLSNHSNIDDHSQIPVHLPSTSSYNSILNSSIVNLRFLSTKTPKPHLIITPLHESQVQVVVICSRIFKFQIRTLSGGHDFEGLSYKSSQKLPFVILDLINFRAIKVDVEDETAWVQSGATLGQLYYKIAEKSPIHGFPAGIGTSVGVGGHFSGGGYGALMRKYGLAADNILDAQIVNADGEILDRRSMGEDLFWAIRGGGGASFGVVLSWKIKLVRVPPTVTGFTVSKTLEQGAIPLIHKWQYIAHKLPKDLMLISWLTKRNSTMQVLFLSMFLGNPKELLQIMQESFPELSLRREDCIEMSWVQSTLYFYGLVPFNGSLRILLDRTPTPRYSFKSKSDFVKNPIPKSALRELWRRASEVDNPFIFMVPYGGKMAEIAEYEIPFPHRDGNIYLITYEVDWTTQGDEASMKNIEWTRRLYDYMTPYVSKQPREAYLNYRDLDLGRNRIDGSESYEEAKIWGVKYFKNNFDRLVKVKSKVDPSNFFSNEQSIPVALDE